MHNMKRALGQYSTPAATVDYMVSLVLPHIQNLESPTILDPSVGDGIFVDHLVHHGVPADCIWAYDIDETVVEKRRSIHPNTLHRDFLSTNSVQVSGLVNNSENDPDPGDNRSDSPDTAYDVIIGNPPYKSKRESAYIRSNRARLEEQFAEVGIQNMYSMFIYQALKRLKEGGLLCFIVQDSFLTNVYYSRFRHYILNHSKIREITLAPRRLFHHTDADVRTAIILLEKCSDPNRAEERDQTRMRLVDRLESEAEYQCPPSQKVQRVAQAYFNEMDKYNFFVNVPLRVIEVITQTSRCLGDVARGGTGISTGNDKKFLCRAGEVPADEQEAWVPFYKNGGSKDAWYYETPYRMHRDWRQNAQRVKDFLARNTDCYFERGITCSSMGVEFSAAYLPSGCLFGVNANFFFDTDEDLYYCLGFLNSNLAKYMIRSIFNRTNMVTAGYIKRLPYIEPSPNLKKAVADISAQIVAGLRVDKQFDYGTLQESIHPLIYTIYSIDSESQAVIEHFCTNMYEML